MVISAPSLAVHPDGTEIGSYALNDNEGVIYLDDAESGGINGSIALEAYRDASAAWIGTQEEAREALFSWSESRLIPDELRAQLPQGFNDLAVRNQISRLADIVVSRALLETGGVAFDKFSLSDEEDAPLAEQRADGRSSLAGSLPHNDALAAWVRYETPNLLIVDGTTTLRKRVADLDVGEECLEPANEALVFRFRSQRAAGARANRHLRAAIEW